MDNQQERLEDRPLAVDISWLAGAWESDGSFSLQDNTVRVKRMGKGYTQYAPTCQFVNTDPDIILAVINVLKRMGIGYYQIWRVNQGYGSQKLKGQIAVAGIKRVNNFLDYMLPYLRGIKKQRAKFILEFCKERLSKPMGTKYSDNEKFIYNKLKLFNDDMENRLNLLKSSETNMPNTNFIVDEETKIAISKGLEHFINWSKSEDRVQSV
jgi:hypothetical protein